MLQIKVIREREGFTQEALAQRAGISVRTVWRAETLGTASFGTVVAIARALNVSIEDLSPNGEKAS